MKDEASCSFGSARLARLRVFFHRRRFEVFRDDALDPNQCARLRIPAFLIHVL